MKHIVDWPNGKAIVVSSGHAPFTAAFYVNAKNQFLLCVVDENRRVLDDTEAYDFAVENAPQVAIKPGPKPWDG